MLTRRSSLTRNPSYFLASKLNYTNTPDAKGVLLRIKANFEDPNKNPHLGFTNELIAQKYLNLYNIKEGYLIVSEQDLNSGYVYNFDNGALIYETLDQIQGAIKNPEDYNYKSLIRNITL
jgi:hypothetical protein